MKGSLFSNIMRRCAVFLLINAPMTMVTQHEVQDKPLEKVSLNFDSVFTNTPYKKALDTSMRLVGDMQELQRHAVRSKKVLSLDMTDLLVGKLFRLKQAVDTMQTSKMRVISADLEYLKGIMSLIDSLRSQLRFDSTDDVVQSIADLITDIKGTLDFLE